MELTASSVRFLNSPTKDVDVSTGAAVKKTADAALFISDVLVGSGFKDTEDKSSLAEFRQHGLAGYATSAATAAATAAGTSLAIGATVFNPINLANPVAWSMRVLQPAYWAQAVNYGEKTWGNLAGCVPATVAGAALCLARAPGVWVRAHKDEIEPAFEDAFQSPPKNPEIPSGAQETLPPDDRQTATPGATTCEGKPADGSDKKAGDAQPAGSAGEQTGEASQAGSPDKKDGDDK